MADDKLIFAIQTGTTFKKEVLSNYTKFFSAQHKSERRLINKDTISSGEYNHDFMMRYMEVGRKAVDKCMSYKSFYMNLDNGILYGYLIEGEIKFDFLTLKIIETNITLERLKELMPNTDPKEIEKWVFKYLT